MGMTRLERQKLRMGKGVPADPLPKKQGDSAETDAEDVKEGRVTPKDPHAN